jgi:hypothetical protein
MTLRLADGVHGVVVNGDTVLLDIATDAYFCLPLTGDQVRLDQGRLTRSPADLGQALVEAGLATHAPVTPTGLGDKAVVSPGRSLWRLLQDCQTGPAPSSAGRGSALARAAFAAWRGRRLAFEAMLRQAVDPEPSVLTGRLLEDLRHYRAITPWLPIDGACLFRSHMLRAYLARLGHRTDWVFGVRTWPFRAHCWLQVEDVVLDDEAERVAAYSPILVI